MSNASRPAARPSTSLPKPANRDAFLEPYAHCNNNEDKLAAHVKAMLEKATELLQPNIDSAYEDVNATLANTDYFRRMIADKTVTLPHCSNAVKFYSMVGAPDPGTFHKTLVKATHATLIKAWNQYTARKTIRTGEGFVRYVKKPQHQIELHDAHAFDHMVANRAPVGKAKLLPPVRPPATHRGAEKAIYADMPALKPLVPQDDEEEDEMFVAGFRDRASRAKESLSTRRDKSAEDKAAKKKFKREQAERDEKAAEAKLKKRQARRTGDEFEAHLSDDEDLPPLGAAVSIDCHKKDKKHKKKQQEYMESRMTELSLDDEEDVRSVRKMPALVPISASKMPALVPISTSKLPASDDPTQLKSVDWLRECVAAKDHWHIALKPGQQYVYFAPSDAQINRITEHFAKNPGKALSKERVVSTHLAIRPKSVSSTFETLSGLKVRKDGDRIAAPAVANPRIQTDEEGHVSSIELAGAEVFILPHNNVFQ